LHRPETGDCQRYSDDDERDYDAFTGQEAEDEKDGTDGDQAAARCLILLLRWCQLLREQGLLASGGSRPRATNRKLSPTSTEA
jgi:hypothetical protein